MLTSTRSKKPWTTKEIAFIIIYADYCVYHGRDYEATVVCELQKLSHRTVTFNTLLKKLSKTLGSYDIATPPIVKFKTQGTACIDILRTPADVRAEMETVRQQWGLPPMSAATASGSPTATKRRSSNDCYRNSVVEPDDDRDSQVFEVEDTSEMQCDEVATIDGAADRFTSPEYSSPLGTPSKQVAGKKRALTPEDPEDYEYEPSPKRNEITTATSNRSPTDSAKGTQGVAVPKKVDNLQGAAIPKTRSSEAQDYVKTPGKTTSIIVIDGEINTVPAVGCSTPAAKSERYLEQRGSASLNRGASKTEVDVMSEAESALDEPSPKRQRTGEVTVQSVDNKVDACLSILSSLVTRNTNLSEETTKHINQVIRTFRDPKGSALEKMMTDLESQRVLKAKHRNMVQKLVEFVNLNTGIVFPKEPPQQEVDQIWRAIHDYVVSTIGPNNTSPETSALSAGYLACSAENIAYGRIPKDELKAYLDSLAVPLRSPHAQQALLGALVCYWVLTAPETMLNTMHSHGMMHLYTGVLGSTSTTGAGLATVQQYDKTAAKLMFEDAYFQKVEFEPRRDGLLANIEMFKNKWCESSNIPASKKPKKFAKEVIELKQRLLLSPKHYRIHYVRPGTVFDPRCMQAFDHTNEPISDAKAANRKVILCTLPALTWEKEEAVKEDARIEEVLVKNKRFAPTLGESMRFKPESQVSKATVLISMEEGIKKR